MQPVRPGRKIYSAPCTKCGDELQMPQTEAASFILNARSFSTVYQPPLFHLNLLGRLSWRPISFLAALAVSAISHCGPILLTCGSGPSCANTVLRLRYSTQAPHSSHR